MMSPGILCPPFRERKRDSIIEFFLKNPLQVCVRRPAKNRVAFAMPSGAHVVLRILSPIIVIVIRRYHS